MDDFGNTMGVGYGQPTNTTGQFSAQQPATGFGGNTMNTGIGALSGNTASNTGTAFGSSPSANTMYTAPYTQQYMAPPPQDFGQATGGSGLVAFNPQQAQSQSRSLGVYQPLTPEQQQQQVQTQQLLNELNSQYGITPGNVNQQALDAFNQAGGAVTQAQALSAAYGLSPEQAEKYLQNYSNIASSFKDNMRTMAAGTATDMQKPTGSQTYQPTVAQMYQNVLGRAGDQGGLDYYGNLFGETIDQNEMGQFISGAENELLSRLGATGGDYSQYSVGDLYQNILGRAGDQAGIDYYTQQFGPSLDESEIRQFIQGASPELIQRGFQPQMSVIPEQPPESYVSNDPAVFPGAPPAAAPVAAPVAAPAPSFAPAPAPVAAPAVRRVPTIPTGPRGVSSRRREPGQVRTQMGRGGNEDRDNGGEDRIRPLSGMRGEEMRGRFGMERPDFQRPQRGAGQQMPSRMNDYMARLNQLRSGQKPTVPGMSGIGSLFNALRGRR